MICEHLVRKKPFIHKAIQFTEELTNEELREWSNQRAFIYVNDRGDDPVVMILSCEGALKAYLGDYIIQGISGDDYYPVKKSVMIKSYDFVKE